MEAHDAPAADDDGADDADDAVMVEDIGSDDDDDSEPLEEEIFGSQVPLDDSQGQAPLEESSDGLAALLEEPNSPDTPVTKEVEMDEFASKLVVVEDSPVKGRSDVAPNELNQKIIALQKMLADAKRQQMAKIFGFIHWYCMGRFLCFYP